MFICPFPKTLKGLVMFFFLFSNSQTFKDLKEPLVPCQGNTPLDEKQEQISLTLHHFSDTAVRVNAPNLFRMSWVHLHVPSKEQGYKDGYTHTR